MPCPGSPRGPVRCSSPSSAGGRRAGRGGLLASAAIFLPSSPLVYSLARISARHRGAAWQTVVETGLATVAAGMILAASATVQQAAEGGCLVSHALNDRRLL